MTDVQFFAYLPPMQSAMMVDGLGDNLQVKFNIPLKMSPDGIRLIGMTGKRLRVTVEVLDGNNSERETVEARPVGKSEWATAKIPHALEPSGESREGGDMDGDGGPAETAGLG